MEQLIDTYVEGIHTALSVFPKAIDHIPPPETSSSHDTGACKHVFMALPCYDNDT